MFSKALRRTLLLGLSGMVFFSLGCQEFLNDRTLDKAPMKINFKQKQCLNAIEGQFERYFSATHRAGEMQVASHCIDTALQEFVKKTTGQKPDVYQQQELVNFFEIYIVKKEIALSLATKIMELKQVLLGGSSREISLEQITEVRQIIQILGEELEKVSQFIPLMSGIQKIDLFQLADRELVASEFAKLEESLLRVFSKLHFDKHKYSSQAFMDFIKDVEAFAPDSKIVDRLQKIQKYLPMLDSLRHVLVGSSLDLRGPNELQEVLRVLVRTYRVGFEMQFLVKEKARWATRSYLAFAMDVVERTFENLLKGLELKVQPQILFTDLDLLIDQFELQPKLVKPAIRLLTSRFLDEMHLKQLTGIAPAHLHKALLEFRAFKLKQLSIDRVETAALIELWYGNDFLGRQFLNQNLAEFAEIRLAKTGYQHNAQGQWLMMNKDYKGTSYQDHTYNNIIHSLAQIILRSYSTRPERKGIPAAMTLDDFRRFDQEFQELGSSLGLSDLRSSDGGGDRAKEADLFTRAGNGDGLVQVRELFELINMLYSSGIHAAEELRHLAKGCELEKMDYFSKPYLESRCLKKVSYTNFSKLFSHLPYMSVWVSSQSWGNYLQFYNTIMQVSKVCPLDTYGIETADQRKFVMVITYIEALFEEFDLDSNGKLNLSEVELSLTRFHGFLLNAIKTRVAASNPNTYGILEAMHFDWSALVKPVYIYLLRNGVIPSGSDLLTTFIKAQFLTPQDLSVGRMEVSKVFLSLKSELGSGDSFQCQTKW